MMYARQGLAQLMSLIWLLVLLAGCGGETVLRYNYIDSGNIHHEQGNYERAIAEFREAIRQEPDDYVAYYNRGNAYFELGDLDKALADYTKALELNPLDTDI